MNDTHPLPDKFGATAKWLHWLIAIIVIIMLIFGPGLEDMPFAEREQTIVGHAGLGTLVLLLMLIRWGWRLSHPAPPPTGSMGPWQIRLAAVMHWSLYGLLLLQPIFGILQAMYIVDYEVVAFNLIDYSSLATDDKSMAKIFHVAHGVTAKLIMLLVLGHIAAAFYHHFVQKDTVLKRMLPFGRV